MKWTERKIEVLSRLWDAGVSAREIAKVLSTSRTAVIGKVYRMGLNPPSVSLYENDHYLKTARRFYRDYLRDLNDGSGYMWRMYLTPPRTQRAKLVKPPGATLLHLASVIYSKKTFETVFEPAISDMRIEYFEALQTNQKWKPRFAWLRGHMSVLRAALVQIPVGLVQVAVSLWRASAS